MEEKTTGSDNTAFPINPADAQAIINADRQHRADACNAAIMQLLATHRCEIRTPIQVVEGKLMAQPIVVAL